MKLIELKNISKSFTMTDYTVNVLTDYNMVVNKGDLIGITGPSGAGKSTLLHIIGGMEKPTAGEVIFEGEDVYSFSTQKRDDYRNKRIGFVFQSHYLLDDFTAVENVMLPALIAHTDKDAAYTKAVALLDRVGLKERKSHFPKELSGGEQQRVAVARALMNNPCMILADEPTGNLDKQNSQSIKELLFSLKDEGVAVLIVTHEQSIADGCDIHINLEKV